jgi:hypothetical protein
MKCESEMECISDNEEWQYDGKEQHFQKPEKMFDEPFKQLTEQKQKKLQRLEKQLAYGAKYNMPTDLIGDCPYSFLDSSQHEEYCLSVISSVSAGTGHDEVSWEDAMNSAEKGKWLCAVQSEVNSLVNMGTWGSKIDLPSGHKATNTQFLLTKKRVGGKTVEKARLVFKNSIFSGGGSIFEEVYSPVVDKVTLRLFFAMTAINSFFLRAFDVKTAFLNAEIDEDKYIRLPQ